MSNEDYQIFQKFIYWEYGNNTINIKDFENVSDEKLYYILIQAESVKYDTNSAHAGGIKKLIRILQYEDRPLSIELSRMKNLEMI